jgi:hypothetical protein
VVRICSLYPDLLGTYGDGGNASVLAQRLRWRGINVDLVSIDAGGSVPDSCDLYLVGGGEDGPQTRATQELQTSGALKRAADNGAVVFAVCAGMQILGERFPDMDGVDRAGLGLLDCVTVRVDRARAVGELLTHDAAITAPDGTVRSLGTQMWTSVSRKACAILPPLRPLRPTTTISRACAASIAASTLAELPLVEMASNTSPGWPSARTWREKITLKS